MVERAERNSDGSYDAVDSGGFGKDYHGQDAFGERMGGTGIGGSHFGGKAAGDFSGADELGEGHFTERYTDYGQAMATESPTEVGDATEVASNMRDTLRGVNDETTENSNTGSMDTSFQIGDINEDLEKARKEKEEAEERVESTRKAHEADVERSKQLKERGERLIDATETLIKAIDSKSSADILKGAYNRSISAAIDNLENVANNYGVEFDRAKLEKDFREVGSDALRQTTKDVLDKAQSKYDAQRQASADMYDLAMASFTNKAKAYDDLLKSSFTDKTEPAKDRPSTPSEVMKEATEPGDKMKNAKTSPSEYLTKANKDSTKELPPNRNDFGNHAVDTLKGVTDRITGSVTADALGLKSIEEFARENGYNPEKLSTMKAYQSYQNKQIMKAIPGIVKQIGSYITERVKDAVDPSQLGERVRNTLARYNLATLIGAAILSINSGAGLQASIDQALTMVDPEDQAAVSDYLEDVLNDEGTVNDLKTAFDDALAPQQNSDTAELDESIVNIGRKDNTDYDDFNAGLGSSGTTSSDADVKVFIARNVKADPILRKMISKIGK